jgi:2',3'-cyclic-nucleotide 2'-phosphodiesterase (5'-nucleotidase family)/DNA-binding beta-propeller fold protein YncE
MSTNLVSTPVFTFDHDVPASVAKNAEVAAFDSATGLIFVAAPAGVDVLTQAGALVGTIATATLGAVNSVAARDGVVAIAIEAVPKTDPGKVLVLDVTFTGGTFAATERYVAEVGALPDMITFSPDGTKLLTANEGEPNSYNRADSVDPEGSVSIIDVATGAVTTAGFTAFNAEMDALKAAGVRIFGPNATVAQDLEPEYIAVSSDGATAYVTLQEANAIAVLDIASATFTRILPLGFKDHSLPGNALSANDQDNVFAAFTWPVRGMYQPDGIVYAEIGGTGYLITANEGDARDYTGFAEEVRVNAGSYQLDPTVFPDAASLKQNANLGRLTVTNATGNADGDGDFDAIYTFGGRSFSVWTTDGTLVFDSGNMLDEIIATQFPALYDENRDDNKGVEPESVAFATVAGDDYLFVGLERANAVIAFRVEGPTDFTFAGVFATPGDVAPEVITVIPETDSTPPVLIVPNEVSFTTTGYALDQVFTLQILHASDLEAGLLAPSRMGNFAAIVDKLEDEYANSLTLIAGDAWIPGPFYAAEADPSMEAALETFYTQLLGTPVNLPSGPQVSGRVSLAFMNGIGTDAASWGNHEFDLGTNPINAIITPAGQYPGARFPYLSANLDFSQDLAANGGNLSARVTADGQEASAIPGRIAGTSVVTFGEEKVGLVGATTQILRAISSPGAVTVQGDNPAAPAADNMALLAAQLQPKIDALVAQGINKIVLMSHLQQFALEQALIPLLSGVDIVISAGNHSLFADANDVLRPGDVAIADYPTILFDLDGNPVLQVNSTAEYAYVNRLAVSFDSDGNILLDSLDPAINGVYATTDEGVAAVWGADIAQAFAPGSKGQMVDTLVGAVEAVIIAQDGNTFGWTDEFLSGLRGEVRREETNLGNLTADANLWYARQADPTVLVSLKNGGGIRDSIGSFGTGATPEPLPPAANPDAGKEAGEVSQLDITNSLRFNNTLSIVTVTADGLLRILEHGVSTLNATNTPGQFPQVSGISFSFDRTLPAGERIVSAAIVDEDGRIIDVIAREGELVGDATREIRMVTLNFLAGGGDGYPFPALATGRVDLLQPGVRTGVATFSDNGTEQDALAEFLSAEHGTPDTAYAVPDTTPEGDTRIQNLLFRDDTVLDALEDGAVLDLTLFQTAVIPGRPEMLWNGELENLAYVDGTDNGEQQSSDADDSTGDTLGRFAEKNGDVAVFGADFANGVAFDADEALVTLDWNEGTATLTHAAPWNAIKVLAINDFTGSALTLAGWVDIDVNLGALETDLALTVDGSKRGSIETGAGDDTIVIGVDSNEARWSNLFVIDTGAGNDSVTIDGATQAYAAQSFARSFFDAFAAVEITLGEGDDAYAGTGRDTAIYEGAIEDYVITATENGLSIEDTNLENGDEGTDTLSGVAFFRFGGMTYAADELFA